EVDEGIVIGFSNGDPAPQLPKGTTVTLVVSSGAELEMPNVVGKPFAEAKAELEAMGLEVDREGSDDGDAVVVSTDPSAGNEVEAGDEVEVVVAEGEVKVPDLRGKSLEGATDALEDAGLAVGNVVGPRDGKVVTTWPF